MKKQNKEEKKRGKPSSYGKGKAMSGKHCSTEICGCRENGFALEEGNCGTTRALCLMVAGGQADL